VVDDAVDTGTSLSIALRKLHELCPQAEIRTAALTVTTPDPVVRPDYTIYNNRTLLRFPWSMDARQ
ncbi:MAG: hypothetical protein K2M76_02200, partial [Muribaculaceae bacterium]|nr:hypothetical protein [Muribaculaceae bacterium]